MPILEHIVLTALVGLCLGSFITALSYRLPRGGSVVTQERSTCPSCDHVLGVLDLVPVFSFLFLLGKCRHCKKPIGWTYPLVEISTLLLCLTALFVFGFTLPLLFFYFLCGVCVSIIVIDFEHMIIPDVLNISIMILWLATVVAVAFHTGGGPDQVLEYIAPAVLGVLFYGVLALGLRQAGLYFFKREALGLGDVKFFASAGAWLGTGMIIFSWFMILSGGIGVLLALLWRKRKGDTAFPFGPALVIAFLALLFWFQPGILQYM